MPGPVHDKVMPLIGNALATIDGQPVSALRLSDDEVEMRDRIERFLIAPHASDWFYDTAVELQRTRIVDRAGAGFRLDRYFNNLMGTDYASARTRYETVADDTRADLITLPATFKAICAVRETDRRRAVAVAGIGTATAREQRDVSARKAENEGYIAWFARALDYRYRSYNFALDHLLIASPHEDARKVNALLNELAAGVDRTRTGDFCSSPGLPVLSLRPILPADRARTGAHPIDLEG